jgi:hypothetical protein
MADEAAVLDAGVDAGADTGADDGASGADDGAGADGAGEGDQGADRGGEGGEGGKGADAAALTGLVVKDAGGQLKMTPALKSRLDEMKAKGGEDARLAKMIRASVFEAETLRERGGAKALLEQVAKLEEMGGEEGIASTKEELGQWRQLDEDFKAGKPEVAKDIAAGNPEAFCKIAPQLFGEYAQMDPDGFNGYVCSIVASDLKAEDVPLAMRMMAKGIFNQGGPKFNELGQLVSLNAQEGKEDIAAEWMKVAGWFDRLTGLSKLQSKGPKKPEAGKDGAGEGKPDEIAQREQAQTVREWSFERERVLDKETESAFTRLSGGRTVSEKQVAAIRELFDSRLRRMLNADGKHKSTVDRFLAAKDKQGYQKHMQAKYKDMVPKAMAAAFDAILPGKPGPKAAGDKGKGADAGKAAAAAGTTPAGVERKMGKAPMKDTAWKNSVKWYARTPEMKAKGMYPLKSGKIEQYVG